MRAYIKLSKKNATKEEIDKIRKLLDDAGIEYYMVDDIEK